MKGTEPEINFMRQGCCGVWLGELAVAIATGPRWEQQQSRNESTCDPWSQGLGEFILEFSLRGTGPPTCAVVLRNSPNLDQ